MTASQRKPTAGSAAKPLTDDNPMLGIGLKLSSVALFLTMATCLKAAPGTPVGEMVFFRSAFAILPILVFLGYRGQLGTGLKTERLGGHAFRGFLGAAGMGCGFFALTKLPLPEATTLSYATPLLVVVLSALVLREVVRLYRWSAVALGMTGVLIIAWPRLTVFTGGAELGLDESIGVLASLLGSCIAATAMLMTRSLVRTERSATIVLYFSLSCTIGGLLTLPFGWIMPEPRDLVLLISAGIAGGIAQILLTESFRHADMSVIAPFDYTSLILSVILGYVVFAEIPTINMLVGGLIVVAAGIFIIFREHRLGLERRAARRFTTPQG